MKPNQDATTMLAERIYDKYLNHTESFLAQGIQVDSVEEMEGLIKNHIYNNNPVVLFKKLRNVAIEINGDDIQKYLSSPFVIKHAFDSTGLSEWFDQSSFKYAVGPSRLQLIRYMYEGMTKVDIARKMSITRQYVSSTINLGMSIFMFTANEIFNYDALRLAIREQKPEFYFGSDLKVASRKYKSFANNTGIPRLEELSKFGLSNDDVVNAFIEETSLAYFLPMNHSSYGDVVDKLCRYYYNSATRFVSKNDIKRLTDEVGDPQVTTGRILRSFSDINNLIDKMRIGYIAPPANSNIYEDQLHIVDSILPEVSLYDSVSTLVDKLNAAAGPDKFTHQSLFPNLKYLSLYIYMGQIIDKSTNKVNAAL